MNRFLQLFRAFRDDIAILFFAIFNTKTPGKIRAGMIIALLYLISPIDLIPDTIPVIGLMDDAVIVPTAMMILTNMLPESVKRESASRAWKYGKYMPFLMGAIGLFVLMWIGLMLYGLYTLIFG